MRLKSEQVDAKAGLCWVEFKVRSLPRPADTPAPCVTSREAPFAFSCSWQTVAVCELSIPCADAVLFAA